MLSLLGQTALVTGASSGIGAAIAIALSAAGARVGVNYRSDPAGAEEVVQEIRRGGSEALAIRADVSREADVSGMFEAVIAEFGRLDILVANAGILIAYEVTEFPAEEWQQVIKVNLVGYFLCAKAAAKIMVPQKSGSIIQINSKSGKKGSFRNSAYAASKFGGIGLTQSLALEMAPNGVRVNAICPGNLLDGTLWQESLFEQYARTQNLTVDQVKQKYLDQVPLGRSCTYDDVANVVIFLASDDSSYMTGQAINVTGGQEMR